MTTKTSRRSRARTKIPTPAKEATGKSKGPGDANRGDIRSRPAADPGNVAAAQSPAPADASGRTFYDPEPPPSLVPPEVQAEIDRLIRENRALRAAMRALLGEE